MKGVVIVVKFRNKFTSDSHVFVSNPGSKIVAEYGLVTAEDGSTTVGVVGEKNLDAIIQSNKDTGNVALLVAKYNSGDEEALNRVRGVYGDFRNMPTTYAEMVSRLNECRAVFEALPVDIKEQFDNNPDVFWSEYGSERFNNIITGSTEQSADNKSNNIVSGDTDVKSSVEVIPDVKANAESEVSS